MNFFPERKQSEYIRVYEDFLTPEECQYAIDFIEDSPQERLDYLRNAGNGTFWVNYITDDHFHAQLRHKFHNLYERYRDDLQLEWQLPEEPNLAHVKVKRYDKGTTDRFSPHVDVASANDNQRYVAFLCYLNDVEEGGETQFECLEKPVRAEAGKCIVFPPLWLFKHQGMPAISHHKYSMQTYARYK